VIFNRNDDVTIMYSDTSDRPNKDGGALRSTIEQSWKTAGASMTCEMDSKSAWTAVGTNRVSMPFLMDRISIY